MSTAITAYLDEDATLYVECDQTGPLLTIRSLGEVEERFRLPDSAVELIEPDAAVEHVLERISDVPMTKAVRAAIAQRLDVDIEDVGRAQPRKGAA